MKRPKKYLRILVYLLSIGILGLYVYSISLKALISNILKIDSYTILLIILFYGLAWLFRTFRFSCLFDYRLTTIESFKIQIAGYALNILLPAKMGDVAMIVYLRSTRFSITEGATVTIHSRVFDFLILFIFCLIGISTVTINLEQHFQGIVNYTIALSAIFLLIVLIVSIFIFSKYISKKFSNIKERIIFFMKSMLNLYIFPKKLFLVSFYSLLIWSFEILVCYTILLSFSDSNAFIAVMTAVSFANIMKALPLLPGGMGVYETGFVIVIVQFGIPYEIAVSLAIIDHFSKKLINLAIGYPVALNLGGFYITNKKTQPEKEELTKIS